jgi:hypothetical protein
VFHSMLADTLSMRMDAITLRHTHSPPMLAGASSMHTHVIHKIVHMQKTIRVCSLLVLAGASSMHKHVVHTTMHTQKINKVCGPKLYPSPHVYS